VLDEGLEFIVQTRGGGTGFAETRLTIYGLFRDHIRKLGEFALDSRSEEPGREVLISGRVSFPRKSKLLYQYTREISENGKTVKKKSTTSFSFNAKEMRYEEDRQPKK
jgi:hypothetical protein